MMRTLTSDELMRHVLAAWLALRELERHPNETLDRVSVDVPGWLACRMHREASRLKVHHSVIVSAALWSLLADEMSRYQWRLPELPAPD